MIKPMCLKGEYVGDLLLDDCFQELLMRYSWHIHPSKHTFYVRTALPRNKGGRKILLHRLLLNAPPGFDVDHINHNGLDNRICNLRVCTRTENQRNRRREYKNSRSRYRGVSLSGDGKWQVQIRLPGRRLFLGLHESEDAAALTYDRAADKYFGEFRGERNLPMRRKMQLCLFAT